MCGDSTSEADVERLMGGDKATEILSQFPTKAAKEPAKTTEAEEIPLF